MIQSPAAHYDFRKYVRKGRWNSFYHQIEEIILSTPPPPPNDTQCSILEVGVGSGILRVMCKEILHFNYESMDIDKELKPNHIGSILEMPFSDKQYDIVVCFQVLEHLPYDNFEKALSELFRVAKCSVIISLPNASKVMAINIPKICRRKLVKRPFSKIKEIKYPTKVGHYWEINRKNFEINKIIKQITETGKQYSYFLEKNYRVWENPYHHFFVFKNEGAE